VIREHDFCIGVEGGGVVRLCASGDHEVVKREQRGRRWPAKVHW